MHQQLREFLEGLVHGPCGSTDLCNYERYNRQTAAALLELLEREEAVAAATPPTPYHITRFDTFNTYCQQVDILTLRDNTRLVISAQTIALYDTDAEVGLDPDIDGFVRPAALQQGFPVRQSPTTGRRYLCDEKCAAMYNERGNARELLRIALAWPVVEHMTLDAWMHQAKGQ